MSPKCEKMSKSRGNVITPDEIVYGVYTLDPKCNFRTAAGRILDAKKYGIWQNKAGDGFFYTGSRFGRKPVFLCFRGDPIIPKIAWNGREIEQHPTVRVARPIGPRGPGR